MVHDWGKYINGEVFIEDPIVLNNGDIITSLDKGTQPFVVCDG